MRKQAQRALVLVTDAYGGRGGIALYCRNLLRALCEYPGMERVVAVPRKIVYELEEMPANLRYCSEAAGNNITFLLACFRVVLSERRFDLLICGHIDLLPVARLLGIVYGCPVIPVIYGVESWAPTPHRSVNFFCRRLKSFISIRRLTAKRLMDWAKTPNACYYYLPNCIDDSQYGIRERRNDLIERYNIRGKTVIMTAGRLDAGLDLDKGFDEILEVLPELLRRIPELTYLVMGDGEDRARLERKATQLGVSRAVIFTGYVSDAEKADHYRLADVFAMPGRNPAFDRYPFRFVFLEALTCGVPVVGCTPEDPSEIEDPHSQLIIQVDPNKNNEIIDGIFIALSRPKGTQQPGIENFYFAKFKTMFHEIVSGNLLKDSPMRLQH